MHHRKKLASGIVLLGVSVCCLTPAFSATPIDLSQKQVSILKSFAGESSLKQMRSEVDFNHTTHTRMQQTYKGYPVWGSDAVVHQGKNASLTTMNGIIYDGLQADLANAPAYIFNQAQADKALQSAVQSSEKTQGKLNISDKKSKLMVFVDKNNKAHWAFLIELYGNAGQKNVSKPTYIMDAVTLEVYKQWNNLQTEDAVENVAGGGLGGNEKEGKFTYDGLKGDLPKLDVQRDTQKGLCYMQSPDVIVKDVRYGYKVYNFKCEKPNDEHDKVYWNGDNDKVNGGYSASDDAMFSGMVINNMYKDWYGEVPLKDGSGKPMQLSMCVHMQNYDNAYWDGKQMVFGDGASMFYPLVSIGVAAHEISHGFTEQHSSLVYDAQSGGMNEAFSDMAAQAAEFYAYNHNSWQIGPEIFKAKDEALRYMDVPSKDCKGSKPGDWCSIDNAKDYNDSIDVHYSSGVFNRMFYLMGTSQGWNTKMAFNVMVQANVNYWTANSTFEQGACGVVKATQDYNKIDHRYDLASVKKAIETVGIDVSKCG